MGATSSLLAYVDGDAAAILRARPPLDRAACRVAAEALFASERLAELRDGDLSRAAPADGEILVGCYGSLVIVSAPTIECDPKQLDPHWLAFAQGRTVLHHMMLGTADSFSYGIWRDGTWLRALAMDADNGVWQNDGLPRAFERPFWAGEKRDEAYAAATGLAFHPLEFGEAALYDMFGYQLEGQQAPDALEPRGFPLMRFARERERPRWKFW